MDFVSPSFLIGAGITAIAALFYRSVVPSNTAHLPGLHAYQSPQAQNVGSTPTQILDNLKNDLSSPDLYPPHLLPNGAWLETPIGRVRYHVFGPADGRELIYVNGLSAVCGTSQDFLTKMAAAGFRVLAYDHFGRGHSSCPPGMYDLSFHVTQLRLLVLETRFNDGGFVLVGNSMGGAISTDYARRYPDDVKALALLAPAGVMERPAISKVLAVPYLGEFLVHGLSEQLRNFGFGAPHARSPSITDDTTFLEVVNIMQSRVNPGHRRAILQTVRNLTLWGMESTFEEVGKHGRKVVVVWGTADRVVPYPVSRKVCSLIPGAKLVTVDGAGHLLVSDHAKLVSEALIRGVL
ncbi:alpha/beta-hydrolase [Gonapodya prolifera JEL478]|uniref:Alpha/beta-hydrolase n=1 Tax=Gonapodya prolifera (strain JEL478) TaxID=1344416 RepID=A0A139AYI7_GONPJ|nr:alpha/beta-hydrolase [Gonapodya prolifera JEL478]|eukprot:KXS21774.1 alpha/beta-hydrolase [Gonapodya prolifera JEL478]